MGQYFKVFSKIDREGAGAYNGRKVIFRCRRKKKGESYESHSSD